ncbi:MAG: AhpC/TSA family protein [Gammaproteobacteria bacterium CG22_combo_CG10-13_8_21_14_all_40_8]|nr:MAG: AhpC/TSA family protein [Gammaproteobacteria bacterium CG22_combo_CG10-13_8_21_14_all_40_8]
MKPLDFFLALYIFFSLNMAFAKMPPYKDTGVALDTLAPELQVRDIENKPQTLSSLSGENGLVLVFFRSADWCPFCKRHLLEMKTWEDPLQKQGYKIAAVSYDSIETLKTFSQANSLPYPLLADQKHQTIISFNVLNQEEAPGTMGYGIPYPGAMIIDNKGLVKFKYFYEGYKDRVNLQQILTALPTKH